MNNKIHTLTKSLLCAAMIAATGASMAGDHRSHGTSYEVSFTNLTPGQPIARLMVASHRAGMTLLNTSNEELAYLAEAGNGQPMADALNGMPGITSAIVGDTGHAPGASSTLIIRAKNRDHISLGAMLGNTNDAFVGLMDVDLPKGKESVTYLAPAYDAGTETNDESCATVPGPACGGEALSPADPGEGFVTIHNGIHGIGGMDAALYDWRNPVARIVIKKVR